MKTKNINLMKLSSDRQLLLIESEDGRVFGLKLKRITECFDTEEEKPLKDFMSMLEDIGQEFFKTATDTAEKFSETRTEFLKNLKKWVDGELNDN